MVSRFKSAATFPEQQIQSRGKKERKKIWPVLRLTIPDGEMEFGVLGVPGEAEEAGVAGVAGVTGVAGAGGGDSGVGTALNTSSFWKRQHKFLLPQIVASSVFTEKQKARHDLWGKVSQCFRRGGKTIVRNPERHTPPSVRKQVCCSMERVV